jgi:hypothetical protein
MLARLEQNWNVYASIRVRLVGSLRLTKLLQYYK